MNDMAATAYAMLIQVLPWILFFHVAYWVACILSSFLSSAYQEMKGHLQAYWAASVVANLHAVIVVALACRALLNGWPSLVSSNDFFISTPESLQCCHCFLGYIISDLVLSLYYNTAWDGFAANLAHHIFVIVCWSQLIVGEFGQVFALGSALMEGSTPFVNFRWMLDKSGMKDHKLYLVNGLTMVILFFLLRVVGFIWMGFKLYLQRETFLSIPMLQWSTIGLCYAVGLLLQLFWFNKMFRGALKALGVTDGFQKVATAEEP